MRILHINNVAGTSTALSRAQRNQGHQSDVLVYRRHKFDYGHDFIHTTTAPSAIQDTSIKELYEMVDRGLDLFKRTHNYDVLHFHTRSIVDGPFPLLPRGIDVALWGTLDQTVVVHFHGSDIRWKGVPAFYRWFADELVVSTPDLLKWAPTATWVPNPIDVDAIEYDGVTEKDGTTTVVHAPSNRQTKGTEHVTAAIDELRERGHDVELEIIEDVPHDKAMDAYRRADIVVDWINEEYGIYGMVSIEAMASGTPVCATLSKRVRAHTPDCPIVAVTPETLADQLADLVENPDMRAERAQEGREWVESIHATEAVLPQIDHLY